jgi:hypothetical protein
MVIDDIHRLTNSLTPREATYFTTYLRKKKVQYLAFYLNLFNQLRSPKGYNEQTIINQIKDPR